MAINKQAKNIHIKVQNDYRLEAGKLVKTADKVNIEAKHGNLTLDSSKKVQTRGNQNSGQ